MSKKITKATFKSFIRKNAGELYIKNLSSFDGMTDCVERIEGAQFRPVNVSEINCPSNTCGIAGVWLVGGSRNSFTLYDDGEYQGIECYNCCGNFIVGVKK